MAGAAARNSSRLPWPFVHQQSFGGEILHLRPQASFGVISVLAAIAELAPVIANLSPKDKDTWAGPIGKSKESPPPLAPLIAEPRPSTTGSCGGGHCDGADGSRGQRGWACQGHVCHHNSAGIEEDGRHMKMTMRRRRQQQAAWGE